MKITEARQILSNSRASTERKKIARQVVRIADYRNLLSRSKAKLIGLRFNPTDKQLAAEAKRAKEFRFWSKDAEGPRPFAKGIIPSEAESAPGLSTMFTNMQEEYGAKEGRSVFYAQLRKITPVSKLMRHVFTTLKKILVAKQKDDKVRLDGLRVELARLRRLVASFENFREQKQFARAALELKKIEFLL